MSDKPAQEVWTSTLKRTIQTAAGLSLPTKEWKLLDEIHAGICDGMSYADIERDMPDVHRASNGRQSSLSLSPGRVL